MKVIDILDKLPDKNYILIHPQGVPIDECEFHKTFNLHNEQYYNYTVTGLVTRQSSRCGSYLLIHCYERGAKTWTITKFGYASLKNERT